MSPQDAKLAEYLDASIAETKANRIVWERLNPAVYYFDRPDNGRTVRVILQRPPPPAAHQSFTIEDAVIGPQIQLRVVVDGADIVLKIDSQSDLSAGAKLNKLFDLVAAQFRERGRESGLELLGKILGKGSGV
jgi:hypothetical protein